MKQIDARGQKCPFPEIYTQKALEDMDAGIVVALVDSEDARDNIVKLAESLDCGVMVEKEGKDFRVFIKKGPITSLPPRLDPVRTSFSLFVTSSTIGKGSDELGAILIKSFFYSLAHSEFFPQHVIFVNSGVLLGCENSPILTYLLELEKNGVEVLFSGACLDHFGIKHRLCAGTICNMFVILEKLAQVDKTITI